MAEAGWPRHAFRIGVFEFRRSVTDLWSSKLRLLAIVAGVGFPSLFVLAAAYAVTVGAVDVTQFVGPSIPPSVRGGITGGWLMIAFFVAQRTASARPRPPAESLTLTTVSRRTTAVGLFVAESLRLLAYVAVPTAGVAWIAFQALGTPSALVSVPVGVVLLATSGVAVGSIVGYGAVSLIARFPIVARHRTALSGIASLGFVVVYFGIQFAGLGGVTIGLLSSVPVGGIADAAIVTAGIASPTMAAAGVVTVLGALVASGVVAEWLVDLIWYRTPVSRDSAEGEGAVETNHGRDEWLGTAVADALPLVRFPSVASAPTNRVAAMTVARTLRNPRRLSIFLFPFFGLVYGFAGGDTDLDTVVRLLPVGLAVVVPWVAGTMFSLNPFGDEGAVLPITLTATTGHHYVRGIILPGFLVGIPASLLTVLGTGLLSPHSVAEVALLAGTGVFVTCVAVAVGPAIGLYWPRFSGFSIGQADEVLPPSMLAMLLSAVVIGVPGGILATLVVAPGIARGVVAATFGFLPGGILALLGQILSPLGTPAAWFFGVGEAIGGVDLVTFRTVGAPTLVLGGVVAAGVSYWAAVRRFERYVPP